MLGRQKPYRSPNHHLTLVLYGIDLLGLNHLIGKKTYIGQIPLISIFTKPFHPPLASKMMTCFPCLDPSERFRRRPAHPLHVKSSSIWPTVPSSKGSRSKPETHTQRFLKMPKELKLTLDNFQFFIGTFTYFKQKVGRCV